MSKCQKQKQKQRVQPVQLKQLIAGSSRHGRLSSQKARALFETLNSDSDASSDNEWNVRSSGDDDSDGDYADLGLDQDIEEPSTSTSTATARSTSTSTKKRKRPIPPKEIWTQLDIPVSTRNTLVSDSSSGPVPMDDDREETTVTPHFDLLTKNRRPTGINDRLGLGGDCKAIDCFIALFTIEIVDSLVRSINAYAERRVQINNHQLAHSQCLQNGSPFLVPTCINSLHYKFFAVLIGMGIVKTIFQQLRYFSTISFDLHLSFDQTLKHSTTQCCM